MVEQTLPDASKETKEAAAKKTMSVAKTYHEAVRGKIGIRGDIDKSVSLTMGNVHVGKDASDTTVGFW